MFQTGYILDRQSDLSWFLLLPFIAVAAGLAGQTWLPVTAAGSVGLWTTIPHHFATWLRTFGFSDEWHRWKDRLLAGPLVIIAFTTFALMWSPLTRLIPMTL